MIYSIVRMASRISSHSSNDTSFDMLFYTSLSANICSLFYFFIFYAANQLIVSCCKASSTGLAGKLKNAHQNKRTFMRNLYFDCILYTGMMCATTVLILTTQSMNIPFQTNCSHSLRVLYACITGVYIFLFFKEVIVAKHTPNKWMNLIIYGVSVATLATVVITREDIVIVAIMVISNGDVLNVTAARLMKNILHLRGSSSYRIAIFMGTYATVVFRALLPIGLIVLALINGKPFNMSYPSVFFFFVGLLFFGALNTWQVNAALARICRKGGQVVEVQSREVHALPKPEDRQIQERIELPPTYDEVCGEAGLATFTNIMEPAEGNARNFANETNDAKSESTKTDTTSDYGGSTETIVNIERENSEESGTNTDNFVDVDLGLGSSV